MCVWGFCEACKHRDENNDEIRRERSDTVGAGTGGNTTWPPYGGGGVMLDLALKQVEVP